MPNALTIRLGTRSSALARWQADWVAAELRRHGHQVALVPIVTSGDRHFSEPIDALQGVGLFTKEIQRALLENRVDLAVHSLKDLPTEHIEGLSLGAIPPRETVADVLISRGAETLEKLPVGARVGTGSMRRRAQLLHARADLRMCDIRGNVDTRIRKLDEGQFDAIVLAAAGLKRLGLSDRISQELPTSIMLGAVGQGALGLECRTDDHAVLQALALLDDPASRAAITAERSLLAALLGGCLAPVGAWGRVDAADRLTLDAVVLSPDGRVRISAAAQSAMDCASELGHKVADTLLSQGAADLIRQSRTGSV